jgi:Flp pilus assembly protein TadG
MKKLRRRSIRRTGRNRHGAAAVEAAIVFPLIALILLGSIDVGQSIYVAQVVNEASREGARRACRYETTSEDEVRSAVVDLINESFTAASNVGVRINFRDTDGNAIAGGDLSAITSGTEVAVQVVVDYDSVRWTSGFAGLSGSSIETTTVMRRE